MIDMKPVIIGIAGSLRNARWGAGSKEIVNELLQCSTEAELKQYLIDQGELHLEHFIKSNESRGIDFSELSKTISKSTGNRGLSNTEIALAAALWASAQSGCEIKHISLNEYFPNSGIVRRAEELKDLLKSADGFLVSTPVYLGDRSSLVQDLVNFIRTDAQLYTELQNKVYAGIAVGAKRNGGQETALMYQLLDMINMGLLGVGSDGDTVAQYGGTGYAGDVGTMARDEYGLLLSMGTGLRIAQVAHLVKLGKTACLQGKVRVMFWVLQDKHKKALNFVRDLTNKFSEHIEAKIFDLTDEYMSRCLACDICPTGIGLDSEYRCFVKSNRDIMNKLHQDFLEQDAIIPVAYSSDNLEGMTSNYQRFIERTRYLRRANYTIADLVTAPLVLEDIGTLENMHVRMVSAFLRHIPILTEPMVAYLQDGKLLNYAQISDKFSRFIDKAKLLTIGRLVNTVSSGKIPDYQYNPVGYIISAEKIKQDLENELRQQAVEDRLNRAIQDARLRIGS
jgi:multimeric flavodoxin WrbA